MSATRLAGGRAARAGAAGLGGALGRAGGFAYGVGQGFEVVAAGARRAGPVGQADDVPAARGGQALRVLGTQVVAVGFGVGGERAENCGRIGVDVRQCRDGRAAARGARTATYKAHDVGRYRTLDRAATTLPPLTPPCRAEGYPAGVTDSPLPPRPVEPPAGAPAEPRPRRRDRHGRGMRGPVAPPQVPLSASRSELFGDLVRDSVERLERRWPQLAEVEFLVGDVPGPPGGPDGGWNDEAVPLGGLQEARDGRPARIVVFRRPVEIRTKSRDEKALLVHEVVVEQVAELLGLSPETVDPRYGQD